MFVFLDVDGVLNKKSDWSIPYSLNKSCLDCFEQAVQKENPKIVLISSWRKGFDKDFSKCTKQIQRLIKELENRGLYIYDCTKVSSDNNRVKEIKHYLKWNNRENEPYIIFDDDKSEYASEVLSGLYLVNASTGFSKDDVKKWRKCL